MHDFISAFDPLAINAIDQLFNPRRPGPSPHHLEEAKVLSRAITIALPPDLSPNERCHYESVVGSSNLGAYHAPVEDNAIPIVIDTGASRSISPIWSDFTTFTKFNHSLHGIPAETRIEGEGMTSWDISDQHGVTSTVQTLAFYVPNASIRLYSYLTMDHTGIELTLSSSTSQASSCKYQDRKR